MRRCSSCFAGVVALLLMTVNGWSQQKTHPSATLITGGPTGTWYMTGAAIAELVNKHYDGQPISVTPGKGAIANPLSVGAGKAELGLSYAPYLKLAYEGGNEIFERRGFDNLRAIAALVPDTVHIVMSIDVEPDVFEQLKNGAKIRIGVGQKGSSNHFVIEKILETYGYDYDGLRGAGSAVIEGAQQGLVDAYQNRQIDIYSNTVGINAGSVREPASARPSRLFALPDNVRDTLVREWGYIKSTIPAGTYPGQDASVETLELGTIVFTNAAMDDEIVYLITKSLAENRDRLIAASAGFNRWQPEDMPVGLPVEIHAGALKYYRERGWVD